MNELKISLITVTYNAERTIARCIESVINQDFKNIQYIIIDGGSTDSTSQIIKMYKEYVAVFVSEPDDGIYDAMNKGIRLAEGDVVGMLNADDSFADGTIISGVAELFKKSGAGIIYGDLDYVSQGGDIVRKWRSGKYKTGLFNWGWMPPHPTFYCKRQLFNAYGLYSLAYGTAADYELMLRFIHFNKIFPHYYPKVMTKMLTGGVSNRSFKNRVDSLVCDLKAMRKNGVFFPLAAIVFKPLRKVLQYLR